MSLRNRLLLALAPALALACSPAAHAAMDVQSSGGTISISDPSGPAQSDAITAGLSGTGFIFSDTGAGVSPVNQVTTSAPCTKPVSNQPNILCPDGNVKQLLVGLGDGNDQYDGSALIPFTLLFAGEGNDNATTGEGDDVLSGGPGNDTLDGGSGDDEFTDSGQFGFGTVGEGGDDAFYGGADDDTLDAGTLGNAGVAGATTGGGKDVYDGEAGIDLVDYSERTAAVSVTVSTSAGAKNDGEAGEQDDVRNAERIRGGSAGDTLTAGPIPSSALYGQLGNDVLTGGSAADRLYGGDELGTPGSGEDTLSGGAQNDRLDGGDGRDVLDGGEGNDTLLAQDGYADAVTCGGGGDTAYVDAFDTVAADCETVVRGASLPDNGGGGGGPGGGGTTPGETVTVTVPGPTPPADTTGPKLGLTGSLRVDAAGRLKVVVTCPATERGGCVFGAVTLRTTAKKPRTVARGTFNLRPGKKVTVVLRLDAATRRALAKARKRRLTLTMAVTASDGAGNAGTSTGAVTVRR